MKKHFKALVLNCLDEETIMKIREWRNQPFVKNMMYSQHHITEKEHRKYITSILEDKNRGLFVFYLDNIPFGVFQYKIYPEGNYAMGGNYLVNQEYQYMGYGAIQLYFIDIIVFNYLCCHKAYSEVLDVNKKLIAMNKQLNVPLEGVLRQHRLVNGKYHDVFCYGLLKTEWEQKLKKLEKLIYKIVDSEYEIFI